MESLSLLKSELQEEYQITKKFIDQFPENLNDYAPHEKSMKLMPLATHIVEVFAWPKTILETSVMDFAAGDYKPTFLNTKAELQQKLEEDYQAGKSALESISEEDLEPTWSMRMGEQVLHEWSKYGAIRHALNQITHHRAQLGVYYRLNNIPLPGSYGPSADEQSF